MRYAGVGLTAHEIAWAIKLMIDNAEDAWVRDYTTFENGTDDVISVLAALEDGVSVEDANPRLPNYGTLTISTTGGMHFRVDVYGPFDPPGLDKHD